MRKALRWFIHWLDTRFPEKVTVTLNDYERLKKSYDGLRSLQDRRHDIQLEDIKNLAARIGQCETGLKAISMHMGFGGKMPTDFTLER